MPDPRHFLRELRRRKVYHVTVAYVVVGIGVLGAAEVILDPLGLEALRPFVVVLALLGLPVALVLAWAYELRPEDVPGAETARAAPVSMPGKDTRDRSEWPQDGSASATSS